MGVNDGFKHVLLLCMGTVLLNNNKKGYGYIILNEDGTKETDDTMYFQKVIGGAGNVYKAFYNKESAEIQGGITWQENYHNRERGAELRIASDAVLTQLAAVAQSNKARNDKTDLLATLKPLRKAWHNTNASGRLALEVRVLNYLRNGMDL